MYDMPDTQHTFQALFADDSFRGAVSPSNAACKKTTGTTQRHFTMDDKLENSCQSRKNRINWSNTTNYLGVTFHRKLTL